MPLQRVKAHVPMARGLAEQLDPRIAPAAGAEAVLLEAKNLRWDKRGAISKRHGFTEITNLDSADDPLPAGTRALFSTGTELCVVTDRQLYSYVEGHNRWYNRGQVGPADGRTREIYHGQLSYTCGDLDVEGDYELLIARAHYERDPALIVDSNRIQVSIVQSVQTTDGVVVVPPTEYSSRPADAPNAPHSPRACSVASGPFGLWLEGTASPAKVVRSDWSSASPSTAPAAPATMFSDVLFDGPNRRTYDAIQIAGGWFLAYIRSTDGAVMLYRYNDAHVLQAAGSIAGPWYRVAVATGAIGQLYLILAKDLATDEVWQYGLNRLTLAVNWGNAVGTLQIGARVMNLGVTEAGTVLSPSLYAHGIWDEVRANVRQAWIKHNRSLAATGGILPLPAIYNATIRSRPFVHNFRTYCWLETAVAGVDERPETVQFFDAAFALDLNTDQDDAPWFFESFVTLAGVHSVGAALPFGNDGGVIGPNSHRIARQYARQCGSAGTVAKIGNNDYRYASTRIGQSQQDAQPRLTMDEVQWLFGELPIVATVHEGAAIIGGSFFAWFAGGQTEELSFVTPPVLEYTDELGAEYPFDVSLPGLANLPDGIYSWQAHWVSSDPRGNLHRSLPGNIIQWEKTTDDAVRLAFRTCPASLRFPRISAGRQSTARVHRAGADAVQKQMTRPSEYRANSPSAHFVEVVDVGQLFDTVTGSGTGVPIYTTGGAELEASCPEGGQIVARVGDRIWLGDQYRRERVQFSKELTPRTGTEDVLAPELNELFGFVVPSGKPVAGIGDLDGKAVVFTSDEIYVVSGRGPDSAGNSNDFSGLVTVSTDTGCRSPRSVVSTPFGVLFAGTAGIYLLDRTLQLSFIGAAVEDTLRQYPYVTSAVLVAEKRRTEVRFTCNLSPPASGGDQGVIVVWNYDTKQWSTWELSIAGPLTPIIDACLHQGVYHVLTSLGRVYCEDDSTWYDAGDQWVTMSASTAWLQGGGQSGWQRIRSATLLQESRDPHDLTIEVYSDFESSESQSYAWTSAELGAFPGQPWRQQPRMGIHRQKCQAIRVRWFDSEAGDSVTGEGYTMAGITFELGIKRGTAKVAREQRS